VRDLDIIKQLLKKYDLMLPVLPFEQRKIYRSKRRTLAVILGKGVRNPFMMNVAVKFYYIMRNLGMQATLASGARAAVFASVLAVMVAAGGSVALLQNYIHHQGVIAVSETRLSGVIAASGDIKIIRQGSEIISARALDMIKAGDQITTGESSALFQFGSGIVVKVLKRSSVYVSALAPNYRFGLKEGGIVSRIPALYPGSAYEVHAPNSTISVKGTEFGVTYENSKTNVFVTHGTVLVKHLPSGTEYEVAGGNSTEVNADKKLTVLTGDQTNLMKGFSGLIYVESISTKSPDEIRALNDKLIESDTDDQPKRMTLAGLKEKYGKIDEVMLYNGRKFTGVIVSRGGVYKILTPGGVVSVPAKEVKGSRIIQ